MMVFEVRPHSWGWKVFEAPGVKPVFPNKDHAIDYAQGRAWLSLWKDSPDAKVGY
jgi:hypothetical protein